MQIIERAREYLEQMKSLVGDIHKEARKKLYEAAPVAVREEARRMQKAAHFVPENAVVAEREEHIAPSGQYKLVVTPYRTGPGTWDYTQGLVYRMDLDKPIAEIQRNYRRFPFAWVEGHEKGDFLLCGEDYQGQTVINLKTGARRDSLPGEAWKGFGFCWSQIHPSPNGKLLCVDGCFWGAPYEIRFYDFSEPMLPPWPELSSGADSSDFFGWIDDERARIGGTEEFYIPLEKSVGELRAARDNGEISEDDYDRYRDDDSNWEERPVGERVWVCPTPLDSLTHYLKDTFSWRRERDLKATQGEIGNAQILLERLTPQERERFDGSESKGLFDWALANRAA